MNDPEFTKAQDHLLVVSNYINGIDLDGFIAKLKTKGKLAPVLDENLYAGKFEDIEAILRIAIATRDFKDRIESIKADYKKRKARAVLKGEL